MNSYHGRSFQQRVTSSPLERRPGGEVLKNLIFLTLFLAVIANAAVGQGNKKFPMISAHRGSSLVAPENTLATFSKAIELGADYIEMDVRTTADGAEVIMHDESMKRTTGLDTPAEKTTLAEIKKLSAGREFGKKYEDQKVPTFEEVCVLVVKENEKRKKPVNLYVDCKSINAGEVIRLLGQYRLLDFAVFYGDINTLMELKKIYEKARLLPAYPGKAELENVIKKLSPYGFDVSFDQLNEETVSLCHAKGIKVFSDLLWSNDKPESYEKAIQLGIDVIQTDKISEVLNVYKKETSQK